MARRRFTEEQIISAIKRHGQGAKVSDLSREMNVSDAAIYRWISKYGGMEVSDARRLRALEEENRRLKHLVADLTLDNQTLKALKLKKLPKPKVKRLAATQLKAHFGLSVSRACRLVALQRSTYHYRAAKADNETAIVKRMKELIEKHKSWDIRLSIISYGARAW